MSERKDTVFIVDAPSDRRAATLMKYAQSPDVGRIYLTSGQKYPGGLLTHNCPLLPPDAIRVLPIRYDDPGAILKAANELNPDLIEVGQEDAIYNGVTNRLRENGLLTFGVSYEAGRYEWDKAYSRLQMVRAGASRYIPRFEIFEDYIKALAYIQRRFIDEAYPSELFLKAAYPCLGKGVDGVKTVKEAILSLQRLQTLPNQAGRKILVEDGVGGPSKIELSYFNIGGAFLGIYQDHKPVFDGDKGPNTGSMGSVGPINWVSPEQINHIQQNIADPVYRLLQQEGQPYLGYLYEGLMYDPDINHFYKLEDNTRNGGGEAAVNLPGLLDDYYQLTRSIALNKHTQNPPVLRHDGKYRVSIAGTAQGYPGDYRPVLGRRVHGLEEVINRQEVTVFGAAIEDDFTVSGGRIFWIVAEGDTLQQAINLAYNNIERVWIPGDSPGQNLLHYRTDIGAKALSRQFIS